MNIKRKSGVHFATPETSVEVRNNMFNTARVGEKGKKSRNAFQFSNTNVKKAEKGQEMVNDLEEKLMIVAKEQLIEGEDSAANSNTVDSPKIEGLPAISLSSGTRHRPENKTMTKPFMKYKQQLSSITPMNSMPAQVQLKPMSLRKSSI